MKLEAICISAAKSAQSPPATAACGWRAVTWPERAAANAKAAPVTTGTRAPDNVLGRAANHQARSGRGEEVDFMFERS